MSVPGPNDAIQQTMEEGPGRYAVFASRLRTAIASGIRFSAYSSEVGEAFRPVTKPIVIRTLYGISWSYVIGDVTYAGYKAREQYKQLEAESHNPALKAKRLASEAKQVVLKTVDAKSSGDHSAAGKDAEAAAHHHGGTKIDPLELSENGYIALVATRRAVLQSIISMALPAFTVHQTVHYSAPAFRKLFTNHKVQALGPTVLGLSLIPFFPLLFDEPGERVIDGVFDYAEALYFGQAKPINIGGADVKASYALPLAMFSGATAGEVARRRVYTSGSVTRMLPATRPGWLLAGATLGAGFTAAAHLRSESDDHVQVSS
ncbi:unnamed protein product [Parajaminaea phylloscopi]